MNCCKPEKVCTEEDGKMLKRIRVLEEGRFLAKEGREWKFEGQKKKDCWKGVQKNVGLF